MIHPAELQELTERVDRIERVVIEHANESLAGQFSILRAAIKAHVEDEDLRRGCLAFLGTIERRVRPLSIALERQDRIVAGRQQLVDAVVPQQP